MSSDLIAALDSNGLGTPELRVASVILSVSHQRSSGDYQAPNSVVSGDLTI
jgi:hypothetical protein